jgi:hypothetical protein
MTLSFSIFTFIAFLNMNDEDELLKMLYSFPFVGYMLVANPGLNSTVLIRKSMLVIKSKLIESNCF